MIHPRQSHKPQTGMLNICLRRIGDFEAGAAVAGVDINGGGCKYLQMLAGTVCGASQLAYHQM